MARQKAFASLGFVPQFKADVLLESIQTVSPGRYRTLNGILSPYLDSLAAKLKALTGIHDRVRVLVESLNGFLHDKHVRFSVGQGMVVRTDDGATLQPGQLSSGERHLLLLLINTLMAHDAGSSLFIIDEPEISLNVKWQRRLVSALLACASRSAIQYVLATHSIELLAAHRDSVVRLVPLPKA
jgi:predicted ATPase